MITRIAIIAGWISVIALGVVLRFEHLSARPMHADEATGARITAKRLESAGYTFDPSHYHGPTLSVLAARLCAWRGEDGWKTMTKGTLRMLTATFGSVLLLVPLIGRRRWGDGPMLLAAALMATSPLLVYYSRMFIHEMLLVLFAVLGLFFVLAKPRYVLAGVFAGLMFATKEGVAVSGLAWGGAAVVLWWEHRKVVTMDALRKFWQTNRVSLVVGVLAALATAVLLYTDCFRSPGGAVDAVRTFFVYETEQGHDKGAGYYLDLLMWPSRSGGRWWFETPVLVLAVVAVMMGWRKTAAADGSRPVVRFLAYAGVLHIAIYSCFGYKTPWLMCLPWVHACLLAGFATRGFGGWRPGWKVVAAVLVVACLSWQVRQTRLATGRYAYDERNPYAYVPTGADVESVEEWLGKLEASLPEGRQLAPVAVVGSRYWPLPWYLRRFETIGYWPEPADAVGELSLVFAMPESVDALASQLGETHTMLPRGLRSEVPVVLFLRNDVWNHWLEVPSGDE